MVERVCGCCQEGEGLDPGFRRDDRWGDESGGIQCGGPEWTVGDTIFEMRFVGSLDKQLQ